MTSIRTNDVGPLAAVGLYELAVWIADPFHVHTALNDAKPMTIGSRLLAGGVNGGLWLVLSNALLKGQKKTRAALLPFVSSFTMNQWLFWWWPYLLGSAGLVDMVAEHKEQLAPLSRWLPSIGDHLVPSNEHAILQPLSLFACVRLLRTIRSVASTSEKPLLETKQERAIFLSSAAVFMSINVIGTLISIRNGGLSNATGGMLTTVQVACLNWTLWKAATSSSRKLS
mmetsp:Transcript_19670/g.22628  ORF Transcript_19670/g.22628 Transcript_19670/m.22628 type:complete len:227 (+) Transcript_19670:43-723(+)